MDLDQSSENIKVIKKTVYFKISFRQLSLFTVLLPLVALVVCFTGAYIFQQSEIHETHCKVYNVIPSISAITGISPERYLWRISIALHLGPRLLIASVYFKYYISRLPTLTNLTERLKYFKLVTASYWLNIVEISALMGVTYISNLDNYPIHEKIFVTFMVSSLVYMLVSLMIYKQTHQVMTKLQRYSYNIKKVLFCMSIICTVGLVVFFMKHRIYCHDLAFSWFALCEYVIAVANMGYHVTVYLDFPNENIMVAPLILPNKFN